MDGTRSGAEALKEADLAAREWNAANPTAFRPGIGEIAAGDLFEFADGRVVEIVAVRVDGFTVLYVADDGTERTRCYYDSAVESWEAVFRPKGNLRGVVSRFNGLLGDYEDED